MSSGDGGGDYWISSSSAISNAFKLQNNQFIADKISQLNDSYKAADHMGSKIMYKRNLEILHLYEYFNLSAWAPATALTYLTRPKVTLIKQNVPLQILPQLVFSFEQNGEAMLGGAWFVTWLEKFNIGDLGMYTEALFEYLMLVYGRDHQIDPQFCFTADLIERTVVSYDQLQNGAVSAVLSPTLDELNALI